MAFWNSVKMAFKSLGSSKLRTFLTMLGVIIGVTTVALLTTVSNGATEVIKDSLGRESRLVTMLTQNAENPLTLDKLGNIVSTINEQDNTGNFIYTAVAEGGIAIDKASHLVDVNLTMGDQTVIYRMRVGATVRGVDDVFRDVREIEVKGDFVNAHNECVVDRQFIDTYMSGKTDDEVIGTNVCLGGKLTDYEYTFSSPVEEDIRVFYRELCSMLLKYNIQMNPVIDETKINFDGSIYSYNDKIDPISYYDPASLIEQVNAHLEGLKSRPENPYEFSSDYDIQIIEHFEGEKLYKVVGILVEEDASLMGSGNSSAGMGSMGSGSISALVEYSKTQRGNVYVSLVDENAGLFGDFSTKNEIHLNGAYFLFENEEEIDQSVVNLALAMINNGYKLFEDCYIIPMNTISQIMGMTMDILTVMLTVIATISLIVGGIGIMNIMLVTVSERTREIGIRKAIGAKTSSILLQFLIEALIISIIGGLLGLLVSFIGSLIIGSAMGISLIMPWWVIVMSLGFCLLIGVVFGMYPAIKASKLQPIDALHRD